MQTNPSLYFSTKKKRLQSPPPQARALEEKNCLKGIKSIRDKEGQRPNLVQLGVGGKEGQRAERGGGGWFCKPEYGHCKAVPDCLTSGSRTGGVFKTHCYLC